MGRLQSDVRAQVLSSEFIIAVLIFSVVLTLALFLWNTTSQNILRSEILYEMNSLSVDAMEKLIRTSGFPEDWVEKSLHNISTLGLSNESRMLDQGKVLRFISLMNSSGYDNLCENVTISNYECSRYLLGLEEYNFYFTMVDIDGNPIVLEDRNCSTGKLPVDEDYLINIERSAILDNGIVKVSFTVWV